jgi:drug/metabolite transporter (DMT)-like permease
MLLVCLIWGINFSMMKFVLQTLPPFALTAVRYLIASAALFLVVRLLEPGVRTPRPVALRLMGLGVVGNTLYQAAFITGLSHTTAGNSALLIASTPVVTAILGALLGVDRITRAVGWSIVVGTLGVILVVLAGEVHFSAATLSGDLLTMLAVFFWALFTHGVRGVGANTSPLQASMLTTVGGTPGLLVLGLPAVVRQDWGAVSLATWGAILYSALLSIVFCYVLWYRSVHLIGANRTALWGLTTPFFALATAALMLGERPAPMQLVGALFILGSVAVNVLAHWREEREPGPVEEGV